MERSALLQVTEEMGQSLFQSSTGRTHGRCICSHTQGPPAFESSLIPLIGVESIKVGQTPPPVCPGQILNARGMIKKRLKKIGQTPTTHT